MKEVFIINPSRIGTKGKEMAKKGAKKNPGKKKAAIKKYSRAIGGRMFKGLSLKKTLRDMPATQAGMFGARWAANRFPDFGGSADEYDASTWNWGAYFKGAIGAVGAGMICNMIKPGMGQIALDGGANLMVYKALENEVIAKNEWARDQFGEDDDPYVPDEYLLTGDDDDGDPYFIGSDGEAYPADERHRLPEVEIGDEGSLYRPGRLGGVLETPGRLGGADDAFAKFAFRD